MYWNGGTRLDIQDLQSRPDSTWPGDMALIIHIQAVEDLPRPILPQAQFLCVDETCSRWLSILSPSLWRH